MPHTLADILLNEGLIARDAAGDLRGGGAEGGERRPVEIAVRDFGVDEVALVAAIRRQVRVPLADPATVAVDADAVRILSRDSCRRLKVLPLAVTGWGDEAMKLELAMADPTDEQAISEVEEGTGHRVEPALMTLSAIEELVETSYGAFVTEVMRRDPRAATQPAPRARSEAPAEGEPPLAIRHQALLELLLEKQIIDEREYEAAIARLLARR